MIHLADLAVKQEKSSGYGGVAQQLGGEHELKENKEKENARS